MSQKLKKLDDMEVIVINAVSALVYLKVNYFSEVVHSNTDIHCNQQFGDKQGVLSDKEIVHPITGNYSIIND